MKLGLVSDTHDNLALSLHAADLFRRERVDRVFHLGDVTDPSTLEPFEGMPLVVLLGNNDDGPWPTSWREELEGLRVGATHGHLRPLLDSLTRECDVVLHGHTHRRRAERVGDALVVNPGALHRALRHSVAVLTLPDREVDFYQVTPEGTQRMRTH